MTTKPPSPKLPGLTDDQRARIIEIAMADLRRQARAATSAANHDREVRNDACR